ncbi:MAG: FixH family protein [Desulfuromonadales bacterium]|nr:FixH family protein [Desulfuromonadales bacterium]
MKKTGKNIYPALILLLLGSFLAFSVWSALRAANYGPRVSDADYYSKGLKYSSTQLEKRAAVSLGWRLLMQQQEQTLNFRLADKHGAPVTKATAALYLYLPGNESQIDLALTETSPGDYQLTLEKELSGQISARLEFEHDGARLSRQLLLSL